MTASYNRMDLSHEALCAWQQAHPELDPDRGKPGPTITVNHDYDTPAQKAELFRDELREELAEIKSEIHSQGAELINIRAEIEAIRSGLTTASQPAPAAGTFGEMMITSIIMTYDDAGKPAYKATGTPYNKFGVRVWDEVLPLLGIDPAELKPGPNPQAEIRARVLMKVNDEGKPAPQKITGKA